MTHVTLKESSGHFTSQVTSSESQDSPVNIMTRLQVGPPGNCGSILGGRNGGSVPRIKLPLQHVVPRLRMSGAIPSLPHTPSGRGQGQRSPHRNRDNLKGPNAYYISVCLISKGLLRNYGTFQQHCVGRDSSVGIVNCYGLGGTRIESRWG